MSTWIDVCAIDDLQPDSGVCVLVCGQQVGLFYLTKPKQVYALANYDPIGKANVLSRGMIGDLNGEPMLASPLYKQHYHLKTGQCLEYAELKLPTFPVRIVNDRVFVECKV